MSQRVLILGWAFALALVAASAARVSACSQCLCGSPTPPGYLLGDASERLSYGLEDRYLSKSNVLGDAPGDELQTEQRVSGTMKLRPIARLALQARAPYVFKLNTRQETGAPDASTRSHGLGDADVLARLDVWRFGNLWSRSGSVAAVADVTAPTGSNDAHDAAGRRLDVHLQPGTGAWSGQVGLAADLALPSAALSASVMARLNGPNARGYHYGDAVLFNLGVARTLHPDWQAAVELNGRSAGRDRTEEGSRDPNSGGTLLYVAPGLRWAGLRPLALDLTVQVPIAQALNGIQTEKTTGRLAIVWVAR